MVETKPHNIVVCCDGTWCGSETGKPGLMSSLLQPAGQLPQLQLL